MMDGIIIFILGVINLLLSMYCVILKRKMNKEKQSALGTIIMADSDSLYIEMNDYESIENLRKSEYAVFKVQIQKNSLN